MEPPRILFGGDGSVCNGTELRELMARNEVNAVLGAVDFASRAATSRSQICGNADVARVLAILQEVQWRCPEVIYGNDTLPTSAGETTSAGAGAGAPLDAPFQMDRQGKLFLSAIFLVIAVVGMIGNMMTVAVIFRTPRLQSHTNSFLASIAISDLLLILVGVPFDMLNLWRNSIALPVIGYCEFISTTISWFTFSSILGIVAVTAERLVAICHPFYVKSWFTRHTVLQLIVATWIVSFFPSIFIGLQFKQVTKTFCGDIQEVDAGFGYCDFVSWTSFNYTFELMLLLNFVLPILFIMYCYVRILSTLNELSLNRTVHQSVSGKMSDASPSPTCKKSFLQVHQYGAPMSEKAQRKVVQMLVTVSIVFFACYLPYHIQRLVVRYSGEGCQENVVCLLLYPVTGLLQYISATLNPVIYFYWSRRFRVAFRHLLKQMVAPVRNRHFVATDVASVPLQL